MSDGLMFSIMAAGSISAVSVVGAVTAVWVREVDPAFLSSLNLICGGVFLSGGLIHLLPEAVESLAAYSDFPMANLWCCAGFLTLLCIETAAESWGGDDHHQTHTKLPSEETSIELVHGEDAQSLEPVGAARSEKSKALVSIILLLALTFHSVLEGLGLGANSGNESARGAIIIAILSHKALAAYSLGSSLLRGAASNSMSMYAGFMALFTAMTPIGIFVGMLASQLDESSISRGVCTALASGTFLYVAVVEVIVRELDHAVPGKPTHKLLALIGGFGVMSFLGIWV